LWTLRFAGTGSCRRPQHGQFARLVLASGAEIDAGSAEGAARSAVDEQMRSARCLGPGGAAGVGGLGLCAVLAVACEAAPSPQLGEHGFAEELVVFGHARNLCPHL
jgi:hypothetical protein